MSGKQGAGSTRYLNSKRRRFCTQVLRERDGDLCWLCKKEMDFDPTHRSYPLAYSIDHVLRVKDGGRMNLDNLRLAHQRCNRRREK